MPTGQSLNILSWYVVRVTYSIKEYRLHYPKALLPCSSQTLSAQVSWSTAPTITLKSRRAKQLHVCEVHMLREVLTTPLHVLCLLSLHFPSMHTSVTLAVTIFLVIHFSGLISIISILFCSLSSSSRSHQSTVKDKLQQKATADGSTTETCSHTGNILCSPEECRRVQMEGSGNKVLLWRYTQACTG